MSISTRELCALAAELAAEHGGIASEYARQASESCEAEGEPERAKVWLALSLLLDDILTKRIDPTQFPTVQ